MTPTTTTPEPLVETTARTSRALKIVLSCDTPDHYFAPLLKDLLEAHGHSVRLAPDVDDADPPLSGESRNAIREFDAQIVLVSPHAVASRWVAGQVSTFEATNGASTLIPVVLEQTDLDGACPELSDYRVVSLRPCMRDGLRTLFEALGTDFLSPEALHARRSGRDRRASRNGKGGADRRTGPIRTRLHVGFQVTYTREAGGDVCASTDLSPESVGQLVATLGPEACRYRFRDDATGKLVPPDEALASAIPAVCESLKLWSARPVSVVFESLAETLTSKYDVSTIDRRDGERRSEQERQPRNG